MLQPTGVVGVPSSCSRLRLYRDIDSNLILARVTACADHLLGNRPPHVLNGISHGAAGFALALACAAAATGREDYAAAVCRWMTSERAGFDIDRGEWRDLRGVEPHWRSQWCHGAVGIGFSRLAMVQRGGFVLGDVHTDLDRALEGADRAWPGHVDTLCCGSLGSVEFLRAANRKHQAHQRLSQVITSAHDEGGYRWNGGATRFNLGLFRGLSGVGYTCLRGVDDTLPNVLTWE